MKYASLAVLSLASLFVFVADNASARNSFEFSNPTFNNTNRFSATAYQQNLQEAEFKRSEKQERQDDVEDELRTSTFLERSAQSSALQQAEDAVFDGIPGDQGSGAIGDQTFSYEVTATNRIFRIDGEEVFNILCDGGC